MSWDNEDRISAPSVFVKGMFWSWFVPMVIAKFKALFQGKVEYRKDKKKRVGKQCIGNKDTKIGPFFPRYDENW